MIKKRKILSLHWTCYCVYRNRCRSVCYLGSYYTPDASSSKQIKEKSQNEAQKPDERFEN